MLPTLKKGVELTICTVVPLMTKGKIKTKPKMQQTAALTPSSRLAGALHAPFSTR